MNNTRKRLAGIFACALTGVLLSAGVTACGKEENYRSIFTTPEYAVNALSFEEMDTYEAVSYTHLSVRRDPHSMPIRWIIRIFKPPFIFST